MTDSMRTIDKMYDSIVDDPAMFEQLYDAHPELQRHSPWLYHAARYGVGAVVEFLLGRGHSPNEDSGGTISQSALTAACSEGSVDCVQMLLNAGAAVDVQSLDNNPLLSAIHSHSLACAQFLVAAGIDIHKTYRLADGRQRNALEFAERFGFSDIAQYLIERGAMRPS